MFNNDLNVGDAEFHIFKGKRAKDISRYMLLHVEDDNPSDIVLLAGGNDLPRKVASLQTIKEIASYLINGGLACKNNGVSKVCISSVLPRSSSEFQRNRHKLRRLLRLQEYDTKLSKKPFQISTDAVKTRYVVDRYLTVRLALEKSACNSRFYKYKHKNE